MADITLEELQLRWSKLRSLLAKYLPQAGGLFVFSRLNIYYLTGTFGSGILWLPIKGSPVLMCRRGLGRAKSESPLSEIHPFKSYRDVADILKTVGIPLPDTFAVEMNGLSWALAGAFLKYMGDHQIVNGDNIIGMARATKTPYELDIMKEAGKRHNHCLVELLPSRIRPGMTEMEVARVVSDVLLEHGHHGILRMEKYGEEAYMGHVSSGESANYSSVFNGALGLRGIHPAVPHMGSAEKIWGQNEIMMIDIGFTYHGYQTDKSHVFWAGKKNDMPADVSRAHELCVDIQGWISSKLVPGAIPSEIWKYCAGWADREGFDGGFMGLSANKVAFVGHGIGLAIDEYPVLAEGFDLPLEEGMTLAVEPKIAIEGLGMVGIENTFEVTSGGGVSLTGDKYEIICV